MTHGITTWKRIQHNITYLLVFVDSSTYWAIPSIGHLLSSTTDGTLLGAWALFFEFDLEILPFTRFAGLFDRPYLSNSVSELSTCSDRGRKMDEAKKKQEANSVKRLILFQIVWSALAFAGYLWDVLSCANSTIASISALSASYPYRTLSSLIPSFSIPSASTPNFSIPTFSIPRSSIPNFSVPFWFRFFLSLLSLLAVNRFH